MKEQLIEKVKGLRLRISTDLVRINQLSKTRETSLAYTRLEEGFMFLGKVLGEVFGNESPYPKEKDKATSKIADSVDPDTVVMPSGTDIEVVKFIRDSLQGIISDDIWNVLLDWITPSNRPFIQKGNKNWAMVNHALLSVIASKMWLGMELNNIMGGGDLVKNGNINIGSDAAGKLETGTGMLKESIKSQPKTPDESFKTEVDETKAEPAKKAEPVKKAPTKKTTTAKKSTGGSQKK